MSIEQEIRNEIYRALAVLGANRELLGTVGSWGDTLDEEEVLRILKTWNEAKRPGPRYVLDPTPAPVTNSYSGLVRGQRYSSASLVCK